MTYENHDFVAMAIAKDTEKEQHRAAMTFRRGWSGLLLEIDAAGRETLGLPPAFEQDDHPLVRFWKRKEQ